MRGYLKMLRLYSAVILACLAVTLIGSPVPIGNVSFNGLLYIIRNYILYFNFCNR